jgi:hypothetical protein
MDWDLEAPGLEHYFPDLFDGAPNSVRSGVIGLVEQLRRSGLSEATFRQCVDNRISIHEAEWPDAQPVDVMFAGPVLDHDYAHRVAILDWNRLYQEFDFGNKLEFLRQDIAKHYDFVLIDSRTGVSDTAGICVAHLPDILVLVHTTSVQSLTGASRIGKWAVEQKKDYFHSESKLKVFPVLSRIDVRSQPEPAAKWWDRIVEGGSLRGFYDDWLDGRVSQRDFIQATSVPYTPAVSYGEVLAIERERRSFDSAVCPNQDLLTYPIQGICALLKHDLQRSHDFMNNRSAAIEQAINPGITPLPWTETFEMSVRGLVLSDAENTKPKNLHRLLLKKLGVLVEAPSDRSREIPTVVDEINDVRRQLNLPMISGSIALSLQQVHQIEQDFEVAVIGRPGLGKKQAADRPRISRDGA